jgi:hypothetical protein
MRALFDHFSLVHHDDFIAVHYGTQSVRDGDRGPGFAGFAKCIGDISLREGIDC